MAVWTNFAALVASLASGKAFTDEKAQALAENVKAAFEGDATAVADGITLQYAALGAWYSTVGAVGTYAILGFASVTTASPGSTHAGSGLRYRDVGNATNNGTPSGTWRLMGATVGGGIAPDSTSLFLRIS
jgi:hypothetical protein